MQGQTTISSAVSPYTHELKLGVHQDVHVLLCVTGQKSAKHGLEKRPPCHYRKRLVPCHEGSGKSEVGLCWAPATLQQSCGMGEA